MSFIASCCLSSSLFANYLEPKYETLRQEGPLEIRHYGQLVAAEVTAKGDRKTALKSGFKQLTHYIFGANSLNHKISMTAPVTEQPTAPFNIHDSFSSLLKHSSWKIHFILPSEYAFDHAPQPNHHNIKLVNIPESNYVVIRYSGKTGDNHVLPQLEQLRKFIKENGIRTKNQLLFAYYNPPWTLPFLRRNEIMIAIE
ncbi:MAG: SOUL family heme-binding protein [Parachlamydiaceae bacterium]